MIIFKTLNKSQGQTLIQTLIALVLLSLAALAIFSVQGVSIRGRQSTKILSEFDTLNHRIANILRGRESCSVSFSGFVLEDITKFDVDQNTPAPIVIYEVGPNLSRGPVIATDGTQISRALDVESLRIRLVGKINDRFIAKLRVRANKKKLGNYKSYGSDEYEKDFIFYIKTKEVAVGKYAIESCFQQISLEIVQCPFPLVFSGVSKDGSKTLCLPPTQMKNLAARDRDEWRSVQPFKSTDARGHLLYKSRKRDQTERLVEDLSGIMFNGPNPFDQIVPVTTAISSQCRLFAAYGVKDNGEIYWFVRGQSSMLFLCLGGMSVWTNQVFRYPVINKDFEVNAPNYDSIPTAMDIATSGFARILTTGYAYDGAGKQHWVTTEVWQHGTSDKRVLVADDYTDSLYPHLVPVSVKVKGRDERPSVLGYAVDGAGRIRLLVRQSKSGTYSYGDWQNVLDLPME